MNDLTAYALLSVSVCVCPCACAGNRSLLSTSDKYVLKFSEGAGVNAPVDDKLVMIASALFIDYLFFEGETQCLVNCCVCPPQCWFKLCELYCCGCTFPCRVKCCIDDVIESQTPG